MPPNDDIDDILRAAMKTLDGETPSGYFEDLPKRTLARLEGISMQTTSDTESSSTQLPMTDSGKVRDEDSGLHDIRNLAAASRSRRISSKRIGTSPPAMDEDILASASGSWKSIALPEPARMISLPELAEMPTKADLKAQEKAAKLAAKTEAKVRKSRPSGEMLVARDSAADLAAAPVAAIVPETPVRIPAEAPLHLDEPVSGTAKGATTAAVATAKGDVGASITPMIGSRIASSNKSNKGLMIGLVGVGLAAAAGVAIYLGTRGGDDKPTQAAATDTRVKEEIKPTAAPIEPAPAAIAKEEPKPAPEPEEVKPDPVPVEPPSNAKTVKPAKPTAGKKPEKKTIEVVDPGNGVKAPPKKEEVKKEPPKEGDPDFEQLLKDSGYQKKDADKPKLEKKSLAAGDFKAGMAGVSGSAQGCYKGTQGTAMVKLTIAPSGKVSKVAVTGVGAAEAACVQAAVQGASFPAWDGGPQSFNYSYLLSN